MLEMQSEVTVEGSLTEEQWAVEGSRLANELRSSERRTTDVSFEIGRWLLDGARWEPGGYKRASAITGLSESHLSNLFRVAKAFPPELREPGLTISAYIELLRVNDQAQRLELLASAAKNDWKASDIQSHLNRIGLEKRRDGKPKGSYDPVKVCCPQCQHVFPVKGHKVNR